MSIISKLASSLNHRDEVPNQQLAESLVKTGDRKGIKELVENLHHKNKDIQNDCIKVLYEIGERNPSLIAAYHQEFITLLQSKNNRMVWGAMTALNTITLEDPKVIYISLPQIIDAADKGSVIATDQAVNIIIKLCSVKTYAENAFTLLIEQLLKCPTNQLPMYAENAMSIINDKNKNIFVKALQARLPEIDKDSKKKRIEKVIKKLAD